MINAMGSVKIRTNSGVKMSAPIDTVGELDKVIKFLAAERETLIRSDSKPKKQKAGEIIKSNLSTGFDAARGWVVIR